MNSVQPLTSTLRRFARLLRNCKRMQRSRCCFPFHPFLFLDFLASNISGDEGGELILPHKID